MNIISTLKLIGLSLVVAALAGCGDSRISAVKDTRMRGDEFTVGQTLGKVKECKSTDWSSEIVNNATVVTHTCPISVAENVFQSSMDKALRELSDEERISLQMYSGDVERATHELENAKRQSGAYANELAAKLERLEKDITALAQPGVPVRRFLGESEDQAKRSYEEAIARRRVEYAGQKEDLLKEVENSKSRGQRDVEERQRVLENYTSWKDRYAAAVTQTREAVKKEIDARYDRDHVVQVKTSFRYREGAPAELIYAGIVVDGEKRGDTIPVYLMDPKRMGEFIAYLTQNGFGMDVSGRYRKVFPIRGDYGDSTSYAKGYKYKEQVAAQ